MSADAMLEPLGNVAYVHDGTTEGLLSAIFQAYALHEQPEDFSSKARLQPRLGQSVRYIETDAGWHRALRRESCERQGGMLGMRCCTHRCQMILRLVLRYTGSFGMSWRGLPLRMPV